VVVQGAANIDISGALGGVIGLVGGLVSVLAGALVGSLKLIDGCLIGGLIGGVSSILSVAVASLNLLIGLHAQVDAVVSCVSVKCIASAAVGISS